MECAGCSKSGSGELFLPIFFADGRRNALFLPPRGPPQPPPPRQRPRPLKPTTYRAPVPTSGDTWKCEFRWSAQLVPASPPRAAHLFSTKFLLNSAPSDINIVGTEDGSREEQNKCDSCRERKTGGICSVPPAEKPPAGNTPPTADNFQSLRGGGPSHLPSPSSKLWPSVCARHVSARGGSTARGVL